MSRFGLLTEVEVENNWTVLNDGFQKVFQEIPASFEDTYHAAYCLMKHDEFAQTSTLHERTQSVFKQYSESLLQSVLEAPYNKVLIEKLSEARNHYEIMIDNLRLMLTLADRSYFNKNKVAPPSWNILFRETVMANEDVKSLYLAENEARQMM